jgi:hypothetical protein
VGIKIQTDEEIQEAAQEKFREMLFRKCFMERLEPVLNESRWVTAGRSNEEQHQKILPDYCYNIFELQRRTIYKGFAPISELVAIKDAIQVVSGEPVEEAKPTETIDWEKLGMNLGMGERSQMFFDNELEKKLKQDGFSDLTPEQNVEMCKLLFGDHWLEKKLAGIQALVPEKPVEQIMEERYSTMEETTKKAIPEWHQKARQCEPEAVTKFHAGVTKGLDGFLDENGELKGERKIKLRKTYEFLLLAWPEIEAMLNAYPQKTRNDLWDWLIPFSNAGWIEIQDLEQLNRLCTAIKLRLKEPGAPRKVK